MEYNMVILCVVAGLFLFSGLGFAILSLIYTWLKLKLEEITERLS
jgi:Trk-type K+ transport system membrane component